MGTASTISITSEQADSDYGHMLLGRSYMIDLVTNVIMNILLDRNWGRNLKLLFGSHNSFLWLQMEGRRLVNTLCPMFPAYSPFRSGQNYRKILLSLFCLLSVAPKPRPFPVFLPGIQVIILFPLPCLQVVITPWENIQASPSLFGMKPSPDVTF